MSVYAKGARRTTTLGMHCDELWLASCNFRRARYRDWQELDSFEPRDIHASFALDSALRAVALLAQIANGTGRGFDETLFCKRNGVWPMESWNVVLLSSIGPRRVRPMSRTDV